MTPDQEKHHAFVAALKALYEMYPLPAYKYRKVQWQREHDRRTALHNARAGDPIWMIELFAVKVPNVEIRNIHSLIYG